MAAKTTIKFVTGNKNKLKEVSAYLHNMKHLELINIDLDLPEYQGEAEEVSISKCKAAVEAIKGPVLVEDTCMGYQVMGGLPGPYIKWFLKKLGPAGLYKMLDGWEDKSAAATCTFAYSSGDPNDIVLFKGVCNGKIVPPRGPTTFGWDPCFQPDGFDETFAEMPQETKNSISHRGKALEKLAKYFSENQ